MKNIPYAFAAFLMAVLSSTLAFAEENVTIPLSWQLNQQAPASPLMEHITDFHNLLLYITFAIAILVILLIAYAGFKFNKKRNPEPSERTHNVLLEIIWTIVPVGILIVIAIPSFQMLFYQHKTPEIDMTLKVTGYQWYWGYEYPDHGDINFLSYMIPDDEIDASKGQKRLLETDTEVVLPIDTNIQILVTAADVLHAFAIPAFGLKRDAVPGRLNDMWVRIDKPGVYYGQCSEICGTGHAYMPIKIRAVTKLEFEAWVAKAKIEFSSNDNGTTSTAQLTGTSNKAILIQ